MRQFALRPLFPLLTILFVGPTAIIHADDTPAKAAVPKGEVRKFTFDQSKIFPGTVRDYWIYVPKQYNPAKPACLYVNQDGIQYRAPEVFDELIHKKEMPIVIGVFITPGRVKATSSTALDRFNRSLEYDGLGPDYVRFLQEELLPEVETKTTSDGRPIELSPEGNDRAIGGASSGAICAFTAAWERPECVPPSLQRDRHIRRSARRQRLSNLDSQVRAQADPRLSPGWQCRLEHLRWRLVDGQPGDGTLPHVRRLGSQPRLGNRRPQRRARDQDLRRTRCAGSGKTGPRP